MNQERLWTRRRALGWSAASLLASGWWPGTLAADDRDTSSDFHFLVVNDTHCIDKKCGDWLEGVVKQMKSHKEKIDFCLHVGDLVDDGKPAPLTIARDVFRGLGVPVYAVIGNHDYASQTDRKAYEELFPDRLNYRFEHNGWQFVGLDSSDGLRWSKTEVQTPTLRWLDDTLPKLDRKKPTVLFTHFPLAPDVTNRVTNGEAVLSRFKDHNLRAAFNGHFHGFTERKVGQATVTTNRCCSLRKSNHDKDKAKGYFLCSAQDGQVRRTFVEVKA